MSGLEALPEWQAGGALRASGKFELARVRAAYPTAFPDIAGSVEKAIFWFKNNPLPTFDYKTPHDLVSEGRTEALIRYIQSLQAGSAG